MDMIEILEDKKRDYREKIVDIKAMIKKNDNSYESLRKFKSVVSNSQDSFMYISDKKENILSDLDGVKDNCITAKIYCNGMKDSLNGTKHNIIGVVFRVLIASIDRKLSDYKKDANEYDEKIAKYNRIIEELDDQIKNIKKVKKAFGRLD